MRLHLMVLALAALCLTVPACGRAGDRRGNDQGFGTTNSNIPRPHPGTEASREQGPYGRLSPR
jgi:hypothetical protein